MSIYVNIDGQKRHCILYFRVRHILDVDLRPPPQDCSQDRLDGRSFCVRTPDVNCLDESGRPTSPGYSPDEGRT